MKESGRASTNTRNKKGTNGNVIQIHIVVLFYSVLIGEVLDEESRLGLERIKANDAEIDEDLNAITASIAGLGNIASQMRDEVTSYIYLFLRL